MRLGGLGAVWERRGLGQRASAQGAGGPDASGNGAGGLGWDGRMLAAGLAATVPGLAVFAYLTLTAYLGWLLCRSGLPGWLEAGEEER